MTHDELPQSEGSPESQAPDPVAALLKRALAQPPEPQIHFLPGVQERIRRRTKGRYFGSRRATFRDPIILLLITGMLILLMGAVVFLVLDSLMESPTPEKSSPGAPTSKARP